ncbi:MAG TPA: tryptophan synthase subunit alpha [Polyangia bacterium]|jgi:tryptophan synthase alpha chain
MTRYERLFAAAAAAPRGVFVPFVMLGDPDLALSRRILGALVAGGADALELGLPFSDPVADGPVIQAAGVRALGAGVRTRDCWALLRELRAAAPEVPVGLLVYANLVVNHGVDAFYGAAAAAGVDSVLVADVPTLEAAPFVSSATRHGIAPVLIAPPNASDERLAVIARLGRGYTYVVTRAGVTGADEALRGGQERLLARLRALGAPPPLLGFGISRPEHVAQAIAAGAAGAISGSAVVAHIPRLAHDPEALLAELRAFVARMRAATVTAASPAAAAE